jgi:hypothetical protein
MPTLADLLGNVAASDQSYPFFPYRMPSPSSDLWSPQRPIDPPQLPTPLPAFAGLSPHINTPPSSAASSISRGGILGPIFGNGGNANAAPAGGILQNLFPDEPQGMPPVSSKAGLLGPFNSQTPPADPIAYGAAFPLSIAGWQAIPGLTQGIPPIPSPSSPARVEQPNPAPHPLPNPRITEQLSSTQVAPPATSTIAALVSSASDARAHDGTLSGKAPDPDFGRRYAEIIASDPDLSTAVRMADKAGDKTFKDWLATVLRDLEHNPAAALEAIRQATFTNYVRAETRGSAAEAILNLAVRKAALRLDDLNRDQGIEQARYRGFRVPELAAQFTPQNRSLMSKGLAPRVPATERAPGHPMFHLHHEKQLADGGPPYDLDNIRVISPLRHYQIPTIRSR